MITIVHFPGARVAALEYRGTEHGLDNEAVPKFVAWRRENKLPPNVSATFNIVYPDAPEVRFDLCAEVQGPVAPNSYGVIEKQIAAGRCAVLRHVGPEHELGAAVRSLHAWREQNGETLRDAPLFFQRVNFGPGVSPDAWITDIYLPLA
ncbi:MAG: GyrI-like domain-containing protein [Polyangiales bacterium]